jgi:hypothetical protein
MVTLAKPPAGDTDWAGEINQNWTDIESEINGARPVSTGGTGTTVQFTAGSIVFAGASGVYTQDNANLSWDNTNKVFRVGSTLVVDATNRRVGIDVGGSAFSPATAVHLRAQQDTSPAIRLEQYSNSGAIDWEIDARRARGTIAAPAALQDDDDFLGIFATGYDGTAFAQGGEFLAEAADAWSGTSHGVRWVFKTTASGSVAAPVNRVVISSEGALIVGAAQTPLGTEKFSLDGDMRLRGDFDVLPSGDNTGEIGTDALRWNRVRAVNVVTGDLDLKDEAGEAHWTLREEPDGIAAVNRRTGRKYRFVLEEVAG